jgi:hypothetical protein
MKDLIPVWVALIIVIPQLLGIVLQLFTHRKIELLEQNTNGMKDQLVKVTGEAEFAKGILDQKEKEK